MHPSISLRVGLANRDVVVFAWDSSRIAFALDTVSLQHPPSSSSGEVLEAAIFWVAEVDSLLTPCVVAIVKPRDVAKVINTRAVVILTPLSLHRSTTTNKQTNKQRMKERE